MTTTKPCNPDTDWEAYSPEIDARMYRGHSLIVIVLKTGVTWWLVDEYRMQVAKDRASARAAAERFAESEAEQ